jgi:dolichol-phosphate mannosyltransferase
LVAWVGFKQTAVEYVREERWAGETKYPLKKMVKLSLDGITSFSHKPLKLASYLGFFLSLASFAYALFAIYQKFFTGVTVLIVITLFLNGVILLILGILGEYIGRIYDETRDRPLYIVKNKINLGDHSKHENIHTHV